MFLEESPNLKRCNRNYLLTILFLSTILFNLFGVYIHPLSISISFETIPLFITGFVFGPYVGFFSGFVSDLITFNWTGNYSYSVWFALQPASIGFFGGLIHLMKRFTLSQLIWFFRVFLVFFTGIYGFIFPSELPILFIYLCAFVFLLEKRKTFKKDVGIYILISFAFLIYVSSFTLGILGSISLNSYGSHLLFFKVRTYKELIKLIFFLPFIRFLLNLIIRVRKSNYEYLF